jgi:hypothetical protein
MRITHESVLCGVGSNARCWWSIDVDSDEVPAALSTRVDRHLRRSGDWSRQTPPCRTWGWLIEERVCVTVETRQVLVSVSGPLGSVTPQAQEHVVVVVTYG